MCLFLPQTVLLSRNLFRGGSAGKVEVWRELVAILEEQVGNVAIHGEATCALGVEFGVIPIEVYASNLFSFEVLCDGVMGGEDSS